MLLHRREIVVIVQQRAAMLDAESADDNVGRLAHRNAKFSQPAIVPCCTRGKVAIQQRHKGVPAQFAFNARGMRVIPRALKNLKQNKIADQKRLPTGNGFQPGGRGRSMAAQMRDPNGAIDENHAERGGPDAFRQDRLPTPIP